MPVFPIEMFAINASLLAQQVQVQKIARQMRRRKWLANKLKTRRPANRFGRCRIRWG